MLLLGVLQEQAIAGGAGGASTYDLLATEILTSSQASVTFSGLSAYAADYQHLQIRYTGRTTRAAGSDNIAFRFNGVSTASYSHHRLYGSGSSVASYSTGALNTLLLADATAGNTATANAFSGAVIDILDFANTSKNTTIRSLSGLPPSGDQAIVLTSGAFYSLNAISSISFFGVGGDNLAQYSRFSIYGLGKGA